MVVITSWPNDALFYLVIKWFLLFPIKYILQCKTLCIQRSFKVELDLRNIEGGAQLLLYYISFMLEGYY